MVSQGNFERTWKVREKSGNLKINGYCSLQKLYFFCSRGKNVLSSLIVQVHLPLIRGYCQRKEFAPLGANSFLLQ